MGLVQLDLHSLLSRKYPALQRAHLSGLDWTQSSQKGISDRHNIILKAILDVLYVE